MKKQTKTVKNLIRNKNFYKIRSRNYHHQLIVFKEKLTNAKNKFKKIRQINEEAQQKINKLKTINETIFFQRRRRSFHSFSFVERTRQNTSNTNTSISTKKSTKHFNFKFFINRRKNLK